MWHLPTFWIVGTNQSTWTSGLGPLAFAAFVFSGTIFSTWCYNNQRHSILAVILLHTVANLGAAICALSGPWQHLYALILTIGAAAAAASWVLPASKQKALVHGSQE